MGTRSRLALVLGIALGTLIARPVASQELAQATATPTPNPSPTEAAQPPLSSKVAPTRGTSLAAAAAKIRLQRPAGASSTGVVISDQNLSEVGTGGALSVVGGVEASAAQPAGDAPGVASPTPAANPANALIQRYQEQVRIVQTLEERLRLFDEQLARPSEDPHYRFDHQSPHQRPGGIQDPAQAQRDEVARQLEEERKKLDAIRTQAKREGVPLQ